MAAALTRSAARQAARGVAAVSLRGLGARCASLQVPHREQLFIDGEWRATERTMAVFNPATGDELFQCAKATPKDVDDAVRAARRCFHGPSWGKASSGKARGDVLRTMAARLSEQKEDFAVLETLDNGKPIRESRGDIDACIGLFEYYAGLAEQYEKDRVQAINMQEKDFNSRLVKEPAGVIGMVTPWNFPLLQAVAKVAPALAVGCSMVLKPSSVCPATCMRLGDLAVDAGLPAGALNLINGSGSEAGGALLDHPLVDLLSFTGSSGVGRTVLDSAAKRLVPSCVELGGKGAIVVFDDVDIDVAVDWIMMGIFWTSGQTCSATSRLIVQDTVEEKLMARLVEETKKIKVGDTLDESTQLGSLTSRDQLKIVSDFVERARKEGVEVLCGGRQVSRPGHYYEATILRGLRSDSEAWVEEIFGPVLAVMPFKTEEEALRLANDTEYGLGNAVMTADEERCERVAQQLHAGIVWKNCSNVIMPETPFGGFGKSGFGKEYGEMGMDEYLRTKVITGCAPSQTWEAYIPKK